MRLAAVICETRTVYNLQLIIQRHLKFLPFETQLYIFVGRETQYLKYQFPGAVIIHVEEPFGLMEYNYLLTSTSFWERFLGYERVLVFQSDSMILRPGIEEFLKMKVDFIGSEWTFPPYRPNGGLSLRNPRVMYEVCVRNEWDITQGNEDVAIANYMLLHKIGALASLAQCRQFSCETILVAGTLGVHAIDKYHSKEECDKIYNQYEEG